jgi:hypothetical protein
MSIPSIINKSSITITSFVAVDEALVGLVFVIYSVFVICSVFASIEESNIDESTLPRPKDLEKAHVQVVDLICMLSLVGLPHRLREFQNYKRPITVDIRNESQ